MRMQKSGRRKRIVILGATGSIGESALKVAHDIPERMEIAGLAANSNAEKLAAAANETRPESVCLVDETKIDILLNAQRPMQTVRRWTLDIGRWTFQTCAASSSPRPVVHSAKRRAKTSTR